MKHSKPIKPVSLRKGLTLIVEAVRYCRRVKRMQMPQAAYTKALREPVHFLWERRDGRSKLQAARFRSKNARGRRFGSGQLYFDHAIPFSYVEDKLLRLRRATPTKVKAILNKICIATLLTPMEHRRLAKRGYQSVMPKRWKGRYPFARYRAVHIPIEKNPAFTGKGCVERG
jgi:hypothetical protein